MGPKDDFVASMFLGGSSGLVDKKNRVASEFIASRKAPMISVISLRTLTATGCVPASSGVDREGGHGHGRPLKEGHSARHRQPSSERSADAGRLGTVDRLCALSIREGVSADSLYAHPP